MSFVITKKAPFNLTWVYAKEVTLGGPLDCFRIGAGFHGINHMIRELELSAPFPGLQVGGDLQVLGGWCTPPPLGQRLPY